MIVESFRGIRIEQLHGLMESRDLGNPDTVLIHVGTNDLRSRNLDYVMDKVYALVATGKPKFPHCRLVLSGILRRRDVRWRCIGAVNDRCNWVAKNLGVIFLDGNSWIEDGDFGRDGLHLNRKETRRLLLSYSRVCNFGGEGPTTGTK